ncbi:hypothetical protein HYV84_00450 [Candidatus Woesearchaeota archaeon]|nr:hypothetical protein [Candidatus Woesearchaeota archaeon]
MLQEAINGLYANFPYTASLSYSGKFKAFNANIRMEGKHVQFNLSRDWRTVSKEIQIGLVQELLAKLLRKRITPLVTQTPEMELYSIFMKKVHLASPKTNVDPFLAERFSALNEKYFHGALDIPNLQWGSHSFRTLGHYHYGSDTVTISTALRQDGDLLDYVLYHELLHKKHKFVKGKSRSFHHTPAFKRDEMLFENHSEMETRLNKLGRKRMFPWWFVFV